MKKPKTLAFRYQFGVYLFVIKAFVCQQKFLELSLLWTSKSFVYVVSGSFVFVLHFCYRCHIYIYKWSCSLNCCWAIQCLTICLYCYLNGCEFFVNVSVVFVCVWVCGCDIWSDIQSISTAVVFPRVYVNVTFIYINIYFGNARICAVWQSYSLVWLLFVHRKGDK